MVSSRDHADGGQFKKGEGFFVQYILKTPPGSAGEYAFEIKPPAHVKTCQIAIQHIGENMPCVEEPPENYKQLTGHENVEIHYGTGIAHNAEPVRDCGQESGIKFKV